MAWVTSVTCEVSKGRIQPTEVVANVKIFPVEDCRQVIQIDTYGSSERANPGKQSQTLQFDEEAAKQLFDILKNTYRFR